MKTKPIILFTVLAALAMLIASCAPAAPTEAPTTAPVVQPTNPPAIQVPTVAPTTATAPTTAPAASKCPYQFEPGAKIVFSGWGDQTEQQVYRDSITRFNALCPDISVDYQPIPTDFQTKMKAQMAGGTAPDVFYVDDQLMTAFAGSGQLLALNDLMDAAGIKASDFIPSLMSEFTLDGKIYALPKDWGTLALIYLPDAFTQAGIPEPTQDWTWTDMANAAKAIAAKGKYAGYCMAADWARFIPFVLSNGGDYTSADWKTATLNTPAVEDMATFVANMKKDGSLKTPKDLSASWCGEAIGKELVGMTLEGGWMVNFMKQTYPNVNYKSILIPQGPKSRADIIFTNGLGVNANTKYPKAAAAFDFFVTGADNQKAIQATGFAYSTHPEQIPLITNPIDVGVSAGGLLPTSKPAYWGPYTGKLETAVSNALDRVFLGQQTVAQSFDQAQQEATAALAGQ